MTIETIEQVQNVIAEQKLSHPLGFVTAVAGSRIEVSGLGQRVALGHRARILTEEPVPAEVIRLEGDRAILAAEAPTDGISIGAWVRADPPRGFRPHQSWIGRVIDPDGRPLDGRPILPGNQVCPLQAQPPAPNARRGFGEQMATGLAIFDTLLPIVRGQRIGLFAGSGVGKSTLLADFARGLSADVIVIGLVGERGREVRHFVEDVLGPDGLRRSVVIAATSDRAPQVRRRCAWSAMAVAEYFRAAGLQVALLLDSVTRFAEAHRELAVAAGEPASLRGFPASTGPAIAALCERAGPGEGAAGDITSVFSVLVAGSDMEEPIADMLRGVLDGHVVLDREIAEQGRFPAVDVLRSVSRSLPEAASSEENVMISGARTILGTYERGEMMVQAGLYSQGSDPALDEAISAMPTLTEFLSQRTPKGPKDAFGRLRRALPNSVRAKAVEARRER